MLRKHRAMLRSDSYSRHAARLTATGLLDRLSGGVQEMDTHEQHNTPLGQAQVASRTVKMLLSWSRYTRRYWMR